MEKLKEAFHIALANLGTNAIRSALSISGIVIGIAAVISILAIGAGAKQQIMDRINAFGPNSFVLTGVYDSKTDRMGFFEMNDIERLRNLPYVVSAVPRITLYKDVRSRLSNTRGSITGVDTNHLEQRRLKLIEGRNFSPLEIEQRATLCLINESAKKNLFPNGNAVGESIFLEGQPWSVIGIYSPLRKRSGEYDEESEILAPVTTLIRATKDYSIDNIDIQVKADFVDEAPTALVTEMERGDLQRKGLFAIRDQKDSFARNLQVRKVLSLIGTIVAGISLIVGGIGMMNVMLTSVAERTREIGVRRAVGARKKDILFQFLIESCVLSGAGGVLGLILGAAVARLLPVMFKDFFTSLPRVEPSFLLLAVVSGVFLGVIFGFYPAIKASRLSPAEALRSE